MKREVWVIFPAAQNWQYCRTPKQDSYPQNNAYHEDSKASK